MCGFKKKEIMASIRRLKKDIDYLTFSVIGDSFGCAIVNDKCDEKVGEIVNRMVDDRNKMRRRVNLIRKSKNKKMVGKKLQALSKELLGGVDKAFTELSETVKASK